MRNFTGVFLKAGYEEGILQLEKLKGLDEFSQNYIINEKVIFGFKTDPTELKSSDFTNYYRDINAKLSIVANATIYYKKDLLNRIGNPSLEKSNIEDIQIILEAFKKWNSECLQYLVGDFTFAILNEETNELFCARDHFGCRPFYFHETSDFFAFSTEISNLNALPNISCRVDDHKIYRNAAAQLDERDESCFFGINRLVPAHCVFVDDYGIRIEKYWELKANPSLNDICEEEAIVGLERGLIDSINERICDVDSVFVELSGGLDSSSIASLAAMLCVDSSKTIYALSHTMSDSQKKAFYPFQDESKFSDLVTFSCSLDKHIKVNGENRGIFESFERYFEGGGVPNLQIYGIFSELIFEKVEQFKGKVLLSGLGGDEMISSKPNGYFAEIIHLKKWDELWKEISTMKNRWWNSPIIARILYLSLRFFPGILHIKEKFHYTQISRYNCIYNSFPLNSKDKRKVIKRKTFICQRSSIFKGSVRERQKNDIQNKGLLNRIENCYLVSQKFGVEYRYPLLDVKLLEYYYSLPNSLKYKKGKGRYILRRTMEKHLPYEICWRKDKAGVTIPSFQYRMQKDMPLMRRLIEDCSVNLEYHYFDYKKLLEMSKKIEQRGKGVKVCFGPRLFLYAIQVLMLQKMQKENIIDIGIRC